MKYHLMISELGSNDPPAHDKDYETPEEAISEFVNLHIQLCAPEVKVDVHHSHADWTWEITGLTNDAGDGVTFLASIERWDDDEFSSFEEATADD